MPAAPPPGRRSRATHLETAAGRKGCSLPLRYGHSAVCPPNPTGMAHFSGNGAKSIGYREPDREGRITGSHEAAGARCAGSRFTLVGDNGAEQLTQVFA